MVAAVINGSGLVLIKKSEGLRLTAYLDPSGAWTIGYGHSIGVAEGEQITNAQADALLAQDLATFERGVGALAQDPSSNEFSAMVSLAFNIGLGAFDCSTVLRQHNAGDKPAAAEAFLLWNKAHVDGQLVELPGLTTRREAERQLYLMPDAPPLPPPTETVLFSGSDKGGKPVDIILRAGSAAAVALTLGGAALVGAMSQSPANSPPAVPITSAVEPAIPQPPDFPELKSDFYSEKSEQSANPLWRFGQAGGGRLTIECRQPGDHWQLCQ